MKDIAEDPNDVSDTSPGFGCAVDNRYGQLAQLLDEGADPFDIIREAQAEAKKKKSAAAKLAPEKKKESQKDRRVPVSGGDGDKPAQTKSSQQGQRFPSRGGSGPGEERGERRVARGGSGPAEERGERRVGFAGRDRRAYDNEDSMGFSIERPAEQGERGARGGRGGGRGGRGMERGRGGGGFRSTDGFDRFGKREFERHSGSNKTGVKAEDKKGGHGSQNWGSIEHQISTEADTEMIALDELQGRAKGTLTADAKHLKAPEEEEVVAPEPEVQEMSLDEWKALQEQNRPKAEFNLRKPDTSVPSNSMVIHKSKKEQAEEAEEEEATSLRRPASDITAKLEINFGALGRPSRGGRGGRGRGGRGRGPPPARPETTSSQKSPEKSGVQAHVPILDDQEDFPALA